MHTTSSASSGGVDYGICPTARARPALGLAVDALGAPVERPYRLIPRADTRRRSEHGNGTAVHKWSFLSTGYRALSTPVLPWGLPPHPPYLRRRDRRGLQTGP